MKNLILFFLLTFLFLGCNKDNTSIAGGDLSHLADTHIPIDELLAFVNQNYKDRESVIFSNGMGEELRYNIEFGLGTTPRTEYDISYTHDFFVIQLKSPEAPMTGLDIRGQGIYQENGEVEKSINVTFEPKVMAGSNFVNVDFKDGLPVVNELYEHFESFVTLNGKEFRDVFSSGMFLLGTEAYSEIKINEHEGVVSFKDDNGVRWVFERFEE